MATEDPSPVRRSGDEETIFLRDTALPALLLKDRYALVRRLGEGGFGSVYLAEDRAMHNRAVVVKVQLNQSLDDPWLARKFSDEVRALSMIDHPGVVSAIDSGRTDEGKPFLVMQYVDGVTLRAIMTPEGIPVERAAEILKQMGQALSAAHEKGIWHRDLKPENLMLQTLPGGGERVRLIDFGIATVADLAADPTATRVAGSVMYMAPEQRMGQPSACADIYAMALIAYEVLTGRKPFPSDSQAQLTALQRSPVRLRPSELRPVLSPQVDRLLQQGLEYDPSRRPPHAGDFGAALNRALLQSDVTRLTAREQRPKTLKRPFALAAVAIAVAAAGFGVYRYSQSPKPAAQIKLAVPQLPAALPARPHDAVADQAVELAFWNSVKDSTEPQLYREYLVKYPAGQFESLARAKLQILAKKNATPKNIRVPETPVQSTVKATLDAEAELDLWDRVRKSGEPESYRRYLEMYPNGMFAGKAKSLLARGEDRGAFVDRRPGKRDPRPFPEIEAEMAFWKSTIERNNKEAFDEYLAKYPNGLFTSLARIKLRPPVKPPVPPPFQ